MHKFIQLFEGGELLYHGGERFNSFDPNEFVYATDDIDAASGYAGQYPLDQAEIKTLQMNLQNPLDLRDPTAFKHWTGIDPMSGDNPYRDIRNNMAHNSYCLRSGGKLHHKIRKAGFDGVIFYDTDVYNKPQHTSYVAYNSTSVIPSKSRYNQWWDFPVRSDWK
jgi:hypothetical protein